MKLVILESPYAAFGSRTVEMNLRYARTCALDCLKRNESPLASHLLFPQFLDDDDPKDRVLGIMAGLAWRPKADLSVFYTDHGWSGGMLAALNGVLEEFAFLDFRVRALFHAKPMLPPGLSAEMTELVESRVEK